MTTLLLVAAGYLVGSMPFGYWVVRVLRGEDIRTKGSGNIGTTNVWRQYGWRLGLPIMVLDVAKGFVPTVVGLVLVGELAGLLAGAAAMVGHWRPLFLRFERGGKTVATAGGVVLAAAPLVGLTALAVWLVVFVAFRYASLASMTSSLSMPIAAWLYGEPWPTVAFTAIAAVAVIVLHRPNIARLRRGEEHRFRRRRPVRA